MGVDTPYRWLLAPILIWDIYVNVWVLWIFSWRANNFWWTCVYNAMIIPKISCMIPVSLWYRGKGALYPAQKVQLPTTIRFYFMTWSFQFSPRKCRFFRLQTTQLPPLRCSAYLWAGFLKPPKLSGHGRVHNCQKCVQVWRQYNKNALYLGYKAAFGFHIR